MSFSLPLSRQPDALGILGRTGPLFIISLGCVVLAAVACDRIGWTPLDSRWTSAAFLALVTATVAGAWVLMKGLAPNRRSTKGMSRAQLWLVGAPAATLVLYAAAAFFLARPSRVEWFLNGDHVRHLVLVADIQANGALSYDVRPYPRAWHTAVALLSSVTGSGGSDLVGLVDLMATATWLLYAMVTLTMAALAASMGVRVGLKTLPAAIAGSVAGAATLWPSFLGNYQALGLESSLVAAVVLAVTLREVLTHHGSLSAFLVCSAGLLVMGHTWQLLLPVSGLAAAMAGVRYIRAGDPWKRIVVVAGIGGVVLYASLPSLTAVAKSVGVSHAAVADIVAPVPMLTLAVGLLSTAVVMWLRRRDVWLVFVLLLTVLPALTSVALAARVGVSVTTYYPAKLLWHSALLGLAAIGPAGGLLWSSIRARQPSLAVPIRACLGAAAVLCAVGAAWAPFPGLTGKWSTADGATVLSLLQAPGAEGATVVWSDGRLNTDAITRITLDASKQEETRVDTPQGRLTVDEECRLLRASPAPVILSNRPPAEVRARYGCVPDAQIIAP
ncbi:hypothetical protein [Knoellia aerolata]|nr:hypothetical protein [Knoellia aerolata]